MSARKKEVATAVPYAQRRWPTYVYMIALSLLYLVVFQRIKDERVFLGGDNADYYVLARSIAMGEGFSNVSSPEAPPSNHFPPGYPFVMAVAMQFGIKGITALTFMNGVFLWAALLLLFVVFKRWSGDRELAALVVLLCMFNAHLLQYATIMMSEVPYLLCMAVVLFAYGGYLRSAPGRRQWYWLAALVLVSVLMLYIRSAGLAVVGALGLHLLLRKQWRPAFLYVGVVLLSQVPWQVRSQRLGGSSYTKQLLSVNPYRPELGSMKAADWKDRVWANAKRYFVREVPGALMPWTSRVGNHPVQWAEEWPKAALLVALMLAGLWGVGPQWRSLVLTLMAMNGFILLLWPQVWFGVRFMLPLIPLLVLLAALGLWFPLARLAQHYHRPRWLAWVVVAPVAIAYLVPLNNKVLAQGSELTSARLTELAKEYQLRMDNRTRTCYALCVAALEADRKNPYADKFNEYVQMARWVHANTPRDASTVVSCRKQALFYLFADRYVTGFTKDLDPGVVIQDLAAHKVSHVVVDQLGFADVGRYLVPAIQRDPLKFPMRHSIASKMNAKQVTYLLGFEPELGYHGPWHNGLKHGTGRWVGNDGSVFQGTWVNDTIQGQGVLQRADGVRVEGLWQDGQMNGPGRYVKEGQVLQEGVFVNGQLVTSAR